MSVKKLFELPIMQAIYASIEVIAETEKEAIGKFHEMDEYEMGYPFDNMFPNNYIDDSLKIKCLGVVGGAEEIIYD